MNKIFKLFCGCLVCCGFAAALTSCSDDNDPTYYSEVKVSQSIVGLSAAGDEVTIEVNAASDWAFSKDFQIVNGKDTTYEAAPAWLTLTPQSGQAGLTKVTLKAGETKESYDVTLKLVCGDKTQFIRVIQQAEKQEVPLSLISTVLNGPDATYRVRGVCVTDPDNQYGNWHIEDETGRVYIYGTLDKKGGKGTHPISGANGWDFGIGDIITVEGPKTVYNGTVELVDVTVINIEKSLIKVDSLSSNEPLPVEGGFVTAYLTCKGSTGISCVLPEDADWISVVGLTGGTPSTITFRAAPNEGGDRETTITFTTTDGKNEYTAQTTISQKGAIVEASVADFLAAEVGNTQYRVTGVITSVANASYGNVYIRDWSGEAYVYGIGAKGDFEAAGLKVGDIVTLVGKRAAYKDAPQMGGAQLEKSISVEEVSIADFLAKPDSKDVYCMVTGTVDEIANDTYGNLYLSDGDNRLYVYGCYPGWGATGDNRKGFLGTAGIAVGTKLTMIGYKDTYNGTIELCGGVYFSHESAAE